MRNGLSAPNKERQQTKNHLTEKLPYKSATNRCPPFGVSIGAIFLLVRVPAGAVSSKGRVGRALNGGLALRDDFIIAGIVSITRGASAEITVPGKRHRVPMLARGCHERLREIAFAVRPPTRKAPCGRQHLDRSLQLGAKMRAI